jgi:replicative DNA helicase
VNFLQWSIQDRNKEGILFDLDSERRVLSAMFDSEESCIEAYNALKASDFYSPRHALVFDLLCNLFERETRPTFVEVLKEGHELGMFADPQEIEEIKYIAEQYIDEANIKYWIAKVKEKAKLRYFELFLRKNHQNLMEKNQNELEAEKILLGAEEELTNLTALDIDDFVDTPDSLAKLGYDEVERRFLRYKEIRDKYKGVIPLDGLPTGFDNLNHITLGYKPGDLIILGAQTGHGKTAFALNTAKSIALDAKQPLLYLNTEMSREQIALRWASILTGIEHDRIRLGDIDETKLSIIFNAYSELQDSGFYSYPCPNLTPEKTISLARKFKVQKNIAMMIIDYVGRMDKIDPRLQEWQILEQIVKAQKLLAQNLKIAVLCLVQLNPDGTLQGAKRMKNECDLMLKLSPIPREDLEEDENLKKYLNPNYYIYVEKNRDGLSGVRMPIVFDLQRQTMNDAQSVS